MALSKKLLDILQTDNIATLLDEEKLDLLASEAIERYRVDKLSRKNWEDTMTNALKFAKQMTEPKSFPFEKSSNIILPMVSMAAFNFASRTYPEIIQDQTVVKIGVMGKDPSAEKVARAKRVEDFLTYQLLVKSNKWDDETKRMLHMLPIIGTCFKKVYYDRVKREVVSELCLPQDVVIHNFAKSLEEAPGVTHRYFLSQNDIITRMRMGLFLDYDLEELDATSVVENTMETNLDPLDDITKSMKVHEIYEQHTYLDLDNDGYEEPYILVVHKTGAKVLAIYALYDEDKIELSPSEEVLQIHMDRYFTDFHFLPSPDGGFYSVGYGELLYPLNKAANSVLNQLIDAGTLANTKSGFIGRNLKVKGGTVEMAMGTFKPVDFGGGMRGKISDSIYPLDFGEPSSVLFQLLGLLIQSAKEISSINDVLTGQANPQNAPASAVFELANQGMKVFSSIAKSLHRALKKELSLIFDLNAKFLSDEEYMQVLDDEAANKQQDFDAKGLDVMPVASPDMGSDMRKTAQLNALAQLAQTPLQAAMNPQGILTLLLQHMKLSEQEIQSVVAQPDPNAAPPIEQQKLQFEQMKFQFDAQMEQAKQEIERLKLQFQMLEAGRKLELKESESGVKIQKMAADAMLDRANAQQVDRKLDIEEEKVKIQRAKNK